MITKLKYQPWIWVIEHSKYGLLPDALPIYWPILHYVNRRKKWDSHTLITFGVSDISNSWTPPHYHNGKQRIMQCKHTQLYSSVSILYDYFLHITINLVPQMGQGVAEATTLLMLGYTYHSKKAILYHRSTDQREIRSPHSSQRRNLQPDMDEPKTHNFLICTHSLKATKCCKIS